MQFYKFKASISKLYEPIAAKLPDLTGLKAVAIASATVASVVLGVRHLGGIQPLELMAFDRMVRLLPDTLSSDPRLLVVTITDNDIQVQKKWPLPDLVIARLLEKLRSLSPKVIGLDLYRDIPQEPGHQELAIALKKADIITIRSIDTLNGPSSPPNVPESQVGFNDLPIDPDGVVRRNLLFVATQDTALTSFSLQLALAYLKDRGISPQESQINPEYLQLGKAVFIPLKKDSGGYQNIQAEGYQVILNYRSAHNVARTIPLSEFLDRQIEPNWVKDKIVIIGSTASSLKDNFSTPYSPAEEKNPTMPGVILHAQMVSQLLDAAMGERPLYWFWSEWAEVLWIIGWTIVASSLAWWLRRPMFLIPGIGIELSILFGISFYIFTQHGWIPVASPALALIAGSAIAITYRSHEAQQQQRIVMKLLGQNTSPEVAKALWQGRDRLLKAGKLPGIRLTATVLFSDIRNFSTIAEQKQPEELLEWLNELLDAIAHEVLTREGIINKFTGDGVMAVFGVPMNRIHKEEVAEDAQRAVDCAMAISDRLEELNKDWKSRDLPVIQMRVGIFTGLVVVGSLGGKDRLEYGVIGDSVNIASRLESCEKHRQPNNCRVLIGHETLVHLQKQFKVESWGPLPLKGKEQTVDVYLVERRQLGSLD